MNAIEKQIQFLPALAAECGEAVTWTVRSKSTPTFSPPPDISTEDQMGLVEASGVLDFWNDPEEDKYTRNDGHAV